MTLTSEASCAVTLRGAGAADANFVFRCEADRRPGFDSPGGTLAATHFQVWQFLSGYTHNYAATGQLLFIIEAAGAPVGILELTADTAAGASTAHLGIYISPTHRRHSYATAALHALAAHCRTAFPAIHTLVATVAPTNTASARLFSRAQFTRHDAQFTKALHP